MKIETLVLGELATNCYIVWDDLAETELNSPAMVIDPADSGDTISQYILENNLDLQAIVLTHGHFDHVLGLLELKLNFSHAPILIHEADVPLLARAQQSALHWLGREVDPVPPADQFITATSTLTVGTTPFHILETPGHTPGSICLYSDNLVFTGDTVFKDGVGRTDFSYSNATHLKQSLNKLKNLAGQRRFYAGHGEPFSVLHF